MYGQHGLAAAHGDVTAARQYVKAAVQGLRQGIPPCSLGRFLELFVEHPLRSAKVRRVLRPGETPLLLQDAFQGREHDAGPPREGALKGIGLQQAEETAYLGQLRPADRAQEDPAARAYLEHALLLEAQQGIPQGGAADTEFLTDGVLIKTDCLMQGAGLQDCGKMLVDAIPKGGMFVPGR